VSKGSIEFVTELGKGAHIVLVDSSTPIRREIQQQRCAMPDRIEIQLEQFVRGFDLAILFRVIEPARTNG
jgi:hypothetical protein